MPRTTCLTLSQKDGEQEKDVPIFGLDGLCDRMVIGLENQGGNSTVSNSDADSSILFLFLRSFYLKSSGEWKGLNYHCKWNEVSF